MPVVAFGKGSRRLATARGEPNLVPPAAGGVLEVREEARLRRLVLGWLPGRHEQNLRRGRGRCEGIRCGRELLNHRIALDPTSRTRPAECSAGVSFPIVSLINAAFS